MGRKQSSKGFAAIFVAVVLALAGLSLAGWSWLDALVVRAVSVEGNRHAAEEEILAVARVDTGARLLSVDPDLVADRAQRHPWVRSAVVRRLPPGTVWIRVDERTPVVLALTADGLPASYLDAEGYTMPVDEDASYDVPLLRGAHLPRNPMRPVDAPPLLELLAALPALDPGLDALVSSFEIDREGSVTLHTVPAGTQTSIEVRLGERAFLEKFARLQAFWLQAVLARPEKTFETIDLRFDGQIVTQES